MSIKYCDYLNGDDDTGDGSALTPYQTIDKACEGLAGGDEVRVAKSPDDVELTGTLEWTQDSSSILGTDTEFTTELVVGDFIVGPDGNYYRVDTIVDDSELTINESYRGETIADVTTNKLGVIPATQQRIVSSGDSFESRLKVSGGWDLTTETQVGVSNFVGDREIEQSGLENTDIEANAFAFIELEKLSFLNYKLSGVTLWGNGWDGGFVVNNVKCIRSEGNGFAFNWGWQIVVNNLQCNFNNDGIVLEGVVNFLGDNLEGNFNANNGMYLFGNSAGCHQINIKKLQGNGNGASGLAGDEQTDLCVSDVEANLNGGDGIVFAGLLYSEFGKVVSNENAGSGMSVSLSSSNCPRIGEYTALNNGGDGLVLADMGGGIFIYVPLFIEKYIATGNSNDEIDVDGISMGWSIAELPVMACSAYQGQLARSVFKYVYDDAVQDVGEINGNTSDRRGVSGKCLQFIPVNAVVFLTERIKFRGTADRDTTVRFWLKRDTDFDGAVQGAVFFNDKQVTDWTSFLPTVDDTYEQKTITVDGDDIPYNGVLELRIRVKGTQGNVYLDDISVPM